MRCCDLTSERMAVQLSHRPHSRYMGQLILEGGFDSRQRQTVLRKTLPHYETGSVYQRIKSPHWETFLVGQQHRKWGEVCLCVVQMHLTVRHVFIKFFLTMDEL